MTGQSPYHGTPASFSQGFDTSARGSYRVKMPVIFYSYFFFLFSISATVESDKVIPVCRWVPFAAVG